MLINTRAIVANARTSLYMAYRREGKIGEYMNGPLREKLKKQFTGRFEQSEANVNYHLLDSTDFKISKSNSCIEYGFTTIEDLDHNDKLRFYMDYLEDTIIGLKLNKNDSFREDMRNRKEILSISDDEGNLTNPTEFLAEYHLDTALNEEQLLEQVKYYFKLLNAYSKSRRFPFVILLIAYYKAKSVSFKIGGGRKEPSRDAIIETGCVRDFIPGTFKIKEEGYKCSRSPKVEGVLDLVLRRDSEHPISYIYNRIDMLLYALYDAQMYSLMDEESIYDWTVEEIDKWSTNYIPTITETLMADESSGDRNDIIAEAYNNIIKNNYNIAPLAYSNEFPAQKYADTVVSNLRSYTYFITANGAVIDTNDRSVAEVRELIKYYNNTLAMLYGYRIDYAAFENTSHGIFINNMSRKSSRFTKIFTKHGYLAIDISFFTNKPEGTMYAVVDWRGNIVHVGGNYFNVKYTDAPRKVYMTKENFIKAIVKVNRELGLHGERFNNMLRQSVIKEIEDLWETYD